MVRMRSWIILSSKFRNDIGKSKVGEFGTKFERKSEIEKLSIKVYSLFGMSGRSFRNRDFQILR